MSVRTTPEIFASPYALPTRFHWEKFVQAWAHSNYSTYFWNSIIVVSTAVVLLTFSARWRRTAWPATGSAATALSAS